MSLSEMAKRIDPCDEAERKAFREAVVEATKPMGIGAVDLIEQITECLRLMKLAVTMKADPEPFRRDLVEAVEKIRPTLH